MPAPAPAFIDPLAQRELLLLGEQVRRQRKALRIAAGSVARAANMSRQTLNRIERGEPSVTMGAYLNALRALGLELKLSAAVPSNPAEGADAQAIRLADYPQLRQLAWHRQGETLTPEEAFALYERHWRHVDSARLEPAEQALITRLTAQFGQGAMLV